MKNKETAYSEDSGAADLGLEAACKGKDAPEHTAIDLYMFQSALRLLVILN